MSGINQESEEIQGGRVFCVFKTHLDGSLKAQETRIDIPSTLTEKTLNQYLVQLLQAEHGEDEDALKGVKFEFLIHEEFLRGTIRSHILKHDLSTEETTEIWYTLSLQPPREQSKSTEEDWISSLALIGTFNSSKVQPFVAALYNGMISVYSPTLQQLHKHQIADSVIRAVATQHNYLNTDKQAQTAHSSSHLVYTACDDEILRVGSLSYETHKNKVTVNYSEIADCVGSASQLQCLDLNLLNPHLVCAGNYKGDILIYSLAQKSLDEASFAGSETGAKKLKLSKKQLHPITTASSVHNDKISSVYWKDSDRILSSSHDHHMKLYDAQKQQETLDIISKDSAITTMFPTGNLVLSGHEDNQIKGWDLREKTAVKSFKSHTGWVSSIRALETDPNIFLTTSYDHTAKLWDIRSSFPLFTLKTHHDQILAGIWNSDQTIITAGSDNQVVSHIFKAEDQSSSSNQK